MKILFTVLALVICSTGIFSQGKNFHAYGTEPFWNADISSKGINIDLGSEKTLIYNYSAPQNANGVPDGNIGIIYLDKEKGYFILFEKSSCGCTDGMSDKTQPYSVFMSVSGVLYTGCGYYSDK